MKAGPLADMGATITTTNYGNGLVLSTLLVEHCEPCAAAGRDHAHVIPFGPTATRLEVDGRQVLVWQLVAGSTVEDLTLSPSYSVPSCSGLHGHVRAGRWVPC